MADLGVYEYIPYDPPDTISATLTIYDGDNPGQYTITNLEADENYLLISSTFSQHTAPQNFEKFMIGNVIRSESGS